MVGSLIGADGAHTGQELLHFRDGTCIVRANWKVKNALDRHNLRIGQFLGKALSLGFEHRSVLGVDDQARRLRSWQDGAPIDFGDGS